MKIIKKISNDKNGMIVLIVNVDGGLYMLKTYLIKWDEEEKVEYEVELIPHPTSRFRDFKAAEVEACRLLHGHEVI